LPDTTNANIAFTVREIDGEVPVVVTASSEPAAAVPKLAGASQVIELGHMLGKAMAQRVLGNSDSHVVGAIDDLVIAEASMANTPLVGRTLGELAVRDRCGVNVVGVLERGVFSAWDPNLAITSRSVLVMAGNADLFKRYDARYGTPRLVEAPVVIVGAGRVGIAAAEVLGSAGIEHTIIEKRPASARQALGVDEAHVQGATASAPAGGRWVAGDAAELEVLERAGLRDAAALLVTTHDDDVNAYLTLYIRKLCPEVQIIARANHDRNVSTLHRAGADSVLSYASLGATAVWNEISGDDSLVLAEGIDVFRAPVPQWLAGRTLAATDLHNVTGCNVIGLVRNGSSQVEPAPGPEDVVPHTASLVLVGDSEAEERFYTRED
jgi:Trk K+ transport system NAD-binding subunit